MSKERKIDDSELAEISGAGEFGTSETDDSKVGPPPPPSGGGGGGSGPNAPEPVGGGGSGNQTPSWDD